MRLIDSHTHLYLDAFRDDLTEVVQRAKDENIEQAFLPNIDSTTVTNLKRTVESDPGFFRPMMGLHPCSVKENYLEELDSIKRELDSADYSAVGEIGIDLYWDGTFVKQQCEAFETQIYWAKEKGLPIVIHCRDSFDEIFTIVDRLNDERLMGIFHCFTGTVHRARHIMEYGGFKIGIGGVVTFKNGGLDKILPEIPIEMIVLETDSPYLSPSPHRGERNETTYLKHIAEKVAEIYQLSLEEVAEVTSNNCMEIFTDE